MKHRQYGKKLGRTRNQRQALFRTQIRSFFSLGSIKTTDAKVKAVRPIIEKLASIIIKKPDLISRRFLFRFLQDRTLVNNIITNFKAAYGDQKSNFTLVKKIKFRQGDDALIVRMYLSKPYSLTKKEPEIKPAKTKSPAKKAIVKKTKETKK